jgi:hypothetical protein
MGDRGTFSGTPAALPRSRCFGLLATLYFTQGFEPIHETHILDLEGSNFLPGI